jgi:hypothetical protein
MSTLFGNNISQTYQGLIKLTDSTTGVTSVTQSLQDGLGNNIPIQVSNNTVNISGSFLVNGQPISVDTGSLVTTSSFNAYTSSVNTQLAGLDIETGSLQNQINGLATTGSLTSLSSSIATTDLSQNNRLGSLESKTGSYATTGSNQFNGNQSITGSLMASSTVTSLDGFVGPYLQSNINLSVIGNEIVDIKTSTTNNNGKVRLYSNGNYPFKVEVSGSLNVRDGITGSLQGTASYATQALSASYAPDNSNRNGLINTGSIGGTQSITGSLNVGGTLTATSASITYLETVYETASIIYSSGSNQFGDASNDTQTLWGTVNLPSGPFSVTGNTLLNGNVDITTGNLNVYSPQARFISDVVVTGSVQVSNGITGSLEGTASFATNANSASFAPTVIPDWVATTGSNVFKGFQQILNDVEINSSNPVGTFVSMVSTGTTSFLMNSPLTQFQSNGEMLFQNTLNSTGSSDINFRTQNGGDITFNTNNSGSVAITGSINISGSVRVIGNQINTGSLDIRSGSLDLFSNNTTVNTDLYLTNSLGGQSNIIKGWGDSPASGGPPSIQANYTGSLRITGSNNTVSMPQLRATGLGGPTAVDAQGYISGSDNTIAGNAAGIYLNTGSLLFPKTQGNYVGNNSIILMNFTTSSLAGGHPILQNNTLYAGGIVINSNSGSIGGFSGNLLNGGNINSTQNFVTNTRPSITANAVLSGVINLNHISSSINYQNNISNAGVTVTNAISSSITNNATSITNNTFLGGVGGAHTIFVSGSQSSNAVRNVSNNLMGGVGNSISSSFISSSNSNLQSTLIYGNGLTVFGNNTAGTFGGSTFVGRFNDTISLANAQNVVFAVGTGNSAANRRTGFWIDSGSFTNVSGSLSVKGVTNALTVTGSANITHGIAGQSALTVVNSTGTGQPGLIVSGTTSLNGQTSVSGTLRVGTSNNEGVIQTLGGSQWLYRNTDTYNTVIGNANGVGSGFFPGSEKNMIFNGFSTPFNDGSNNVIIQGGGDNFISGSNNIFIGNHNGHAGGSGNLLLGATSYSSGSLFDDKFELGTQSSSRIFHKQGTDPLQIGDDVQVTGSLWVNGNKQFNVGTFYDTTTQSGSANVSQSISYNTTDISQGVSVTSGTRLTVANSGTYNIQFSAQVDRVSGSGTDTVHIWLKKNGTNVTNSAGAITISGGAAAAKTISSWNYVVDAAASDYYEICWQTTDSNIQLINAAPSGNIPDVPSVIVTVTQVR